VTLSLPKAVIFDWDNTLVDSWGAIGAAINHTRQHFGMPVWSHEEVVANCTRSARDIFADWFGAEWKKAYQVYYEGFDHIRRSRMIDTKDGAHDLLLWLKARAIPAFIVSNKRGDYLRQEVERLQWQDLFIGVAGATDAQYDKPHRAHVDFALKGSDVKTEPAVWFVGDSETDILCAHNADCTSVLLGSPEDAAKLAAALHFPDCRMLLNALEKLVA